VKRIACLRDLERCTSGAIDLLTGEADALGYRVLCDLTREGAALLCEVYGATAFAENWNHGSEDDPHVASAMLSDHAHLDIAPVLLARTCHTVFQIGAAVFGLEDDEVFQRGEYDWEASKYLSPDKVVRDGVAYPVAHLGAKSEHVDRLFTYGRGPRAGSRNVHAMTGRAA